MSKLGKSIEITFNIALGETLRQQRSRWRENPTFVLTEERQVVFDEHQTGKQPDILIDDFLSPPIVIESSFDPIDADTDARRRLKHRVRKNGIRLSAAIALHTPSSFRELQFEEMKTHLLEGEPIRYALHQRLSDSDEGNNLRRWPSDGFITGSVQELAALVPAASLPMEKITDVSDFVASRIERAADILESELGDSTKLEIAEVFRQRTPLNGLRTTMVLWLNALLTQQRLHVQGVNFTNPLDITDMASAPPTSVIKAWRAIDETNWHSIFSPAISALRLSISSNLQATHKATELLVEAVEQIELTRVGPQIDVGAELFPKLSDDRRESAAFYTQSSTAELLAAMTIKNEDMATDDWASSSLFKTIKIADLTCGTGALIRAGYRRIASFHEQAGGTPNSLSELHKDAMEYGVIGADISPIAAHLTAASFAAIGHGEPYGDTNIGWVEVGGNASKTGSLEYLQADEGEDLFDDVGGSSSGKSSESWSVYVPTSGIDYILMNPPYSRSKGGQGAFSLAGLSESEQSACRKRWGDLIRNEPAERTAGMAASFLVLASKKICEGGRIGFVLPLTAAFAQSWRKTRQMILRQFTEITCIAVSAGKATGKYALSADTHMEEMLLIAKKKPPSHGVNEKSNKTIFCITLTEPVLRIGEAQEIARVIEQALAVARRDSLDQPIFAGKSQIGYALLHTARVDGRPWDALSVESPELAFSANTLLRGRLTYGQSKYVLNVPMTTIEKVFDVGSTHDLIGHLVGNDPRGAFRFSSVVSRADTVGNDRALWNVNSDAQASLLVQPTHKGIPVHSDEICDQIRSEASTLFYARNMRWTSQRLVAASTQRRHIGGSSWTSLFHDDIRVRKAFALWTNSILGMIVHWTQGQRTHPGRSRTQVNAIKSLPCPDLAQLSDEWLTKAAQRFDYLSKSVLLPACQAHADAHRKAIDAAVIEMFELPNSAVDIINDIRILWCSESTVHGNNKMALQILNANL